MATKVLIVDDNQLYREAFRRNLLIMDYEVLEAENSEEAVKVFEESHPDLVVTDLSMRTPTEGLELIRAIKRIDPLAPVVMISAVGTFEEGSHARELGADRVLSKQKIDEQIQELHSAIEQAQGYGVKLRALSREIETIGARQDAPPPEAIARLRQIIATPRQHPVILADAYDVLTSATEKETRQQLEMELRRAGDRGIAEAEASLRKLFPEFDRFEPESQKELRTAEYFFLMQEKGESRDVDFSRNIGFSYCFAVENEAKARLRRRLNRFLSDGANMKIIRQLLDQQGNNLDIFYHQYLLRLQQQHNFDFTMDNIRQVFQRILEHENRYKPDGLKALGIMIVCFAREYQIRTMRGQNKISNPMGLKAFSTDEETLRFAHLLVSLQHFRNPYIHPEISEMEKVSRIRDTAIETLRETSKIT